jgi:two-component system LytT family response regulator
MDTQITGYRLAIPTVDGYCCRSPLDLMYCAANGNYSWLYFSDGKKYLTSKSLGTLEQRLPSEMFVRIHNSYIANKMHVVEYHNGGVDTVRMTNGEELDVSRRSQKKLKEQFVML